MNAVERAIALCERHRQPFWQKVHEAARGGHVILTPQIVVIALPVTDIEVFIWLCLGRGGLKKLLSLVPPHIRFLSWMRGSRGDFGIRTVSVQRLKRLCLSAPKRAPRRRLCPPHPSPKTRPKSRLPPATPAAV